MYKLRIYKDSGDLDHEELFLTWNAMNKRYRELFVYEKYSKNPTAWKRINEPGEPIEWTRLENY